MKNVNIRQMVFCALFAALIVVFAQIQVPLPGLVPISLATFGVMMAGLLLGWKLGLLAVAVYVLLGAVGVPVFAGFKGRNPSGAAWPCWRWARWPVMRWAPPGSCTQRNAPWGRAWACACCLSCRVMRSRWRCRLSLRRGCARR